MNELPDGPYKGLAAFGDSELDALLFFGREREQETIVANVLANRLTVLFGPSGVGKSSLLRAGVAQRLRALGGGTVIVNGDWAVEPDAGLVSAAHAADPELGPTAGVVDTIAAAAQRSGEAYLLLDQFEDYFFHHGAEGMLADALPELVARAGLRVNVLIALRDDALSELDAFAGRMPGIYRNMVRLERLDRGSARAAVVRPLEAYGELSGREYGVEPALVDELLDEVAAGRSHEHVEAPFLQLVLERLWAEERATGSTELRLETFRRLGGAEPIIRNHVYGLLDRLPPTDQDMVARLVRQLVTPSGSKTSHTTADLADYTETGPAELQRLLAVLTAERIVRVVEGAIGGPSRYEIFHDVLAEPLLAWRAGYELARERVGARRQRRRLRSLVAAAFLALLIVGAVAVFALVQRSSAQSQARHARAQGLAAEALAGIATSPAASLARALHAAHLVPDTDTEGVLRSTLLAMRETRVLHAGGSVVAASFSPVGGRLLVAGSGGVVGVYNGAGRRLYALPRQHALTHAVWSTDGHELATGGADGTITVWRASDAHVLAHVDTPAPVSVLAFTSTRLLAAGGGHIRIMSVAGTRIRTLRVNGAVVAAALSADARLLAVATRRAGIVTTRVLDGRTGRVRAQLPERGIGSLRFSDDGRLLVTGSTDKTARLWSARTWKQLRVLRHRGHVVSESFSPDGRELVTASSDGSAGVWDVATGTRLLLLVGSTGAAEDATFSPDGKQIAVAFADRTARIYSSEDGRLLAPLAGHSDAVTGVGYDPSGRTIVTASEDGTARLWTADAGDQLAVIDRQSGPVDARFAGAHVLAVAGREARVLSASGRVLERRHMASSITASAADGSTFALVDSGGDVERAVVSGPSETIRRAGVTAVAFAKDGTLVFGTRTGMIGIWRAGAASPTIERAGGPVVAVSAAGGRFLTREGDGLVRVYGHAGSLVRTLDAHAGGATLSPDGSLVATTRARDSELWDVATGKLLHRLVGHRSLVTDAEFSPDGTMLVTASDDHTARIWDVATGRLRHVLIGHFFAVRSAEFSPSGRWIVTASQFTAGLWDATSGQLVLYLQGHTRPLTGATFSPDGNWILTGSEDGTARIVRCEICRNLPGLELLAQQRLRRVG